MTDATGKRNDNGQTDYIFSALRCGQIHINKVFTITGTEYPLLYLGYQP